MRADRAAQPERNVLTLMIQRCHNPKNPKYKHYGKRGIQVCEAWRASDGFQLFLAHIGSRPSPDHEVDRKDNDGNYEPGNVRWVVRSTQMRNTRRTKRILVAGETLAIVDAAERADLDPVTVVSRIASGMTPEEALAKPGQLHRRLITAGGVTRNAVEWSRHLGGEQSLVATRLHHGWSEIEAVTLPLGSRKPSRTRSPE